jgi:hypothetical protein
VRRVDGFFYGLFMDSDILRGSRVAAVNPRRAYVEGFELRIGERATLVPAAGARAYGMVLALSHDDLDALYTAPGLEDYRPEAVVANVVEGEVVPALCYNLREAPQPDEVNAEYSARLREVLRKLGFPNEYIEAIA